MRLDKYLKITRLIKRRTISNTVCDAGKVFVNGTPAKASYQVKIGDIIEIQMGSRPLRAKVTGISEYANKDTAADNYIILED